MKSMQFSLLGLLLITSATLTAIESPNTTSTKSSLEKAVHFGASWGALTSITALVVGQTTDPEYLACTALSGILVGSASGIFYHNYAKLEEKMGKNGALAVASITTATVGLVPYFASDKTISTLAEGGARTADYYVTNKATAKMRPTSN